MPEKSSFLAISTAAERVQIFPYFGTNVPKILKFGIFGSKFWAQMSKFTQFLAEMSKLSHFLTEMNKRLAFWPKTSRKQLNARSAINRSPKYNSPPARKYLIARWPSKYPVAPVEQVQCSLIDPIGPIYWKVAEKI